MIYCDSSLSSEKIIMPNSRFDELAGQDVSLESLLILSIFPIFSLPSKSSMNSFTKTFEKEKNSCFLLKTTRIIQLL